MSGKAVIIGYSGHAYVVLDTLLDNHVEIMGYCEIAERERNPYQLDYLGSERAQEVIKILKSTRCYLGIGDNKIRAKIFEHLTDHNLPMPNLIHRSATLSPKTQIGNATVIMPGVIINAMAKIGKAAIINSAAVIEHECDIDNYTHIAPGAVLAGKVKVGQGSFIGANAVIKQGVIIGSNVIVGAGAVVLKNIGDNLTVYGNPATTKNE